MKLYVKHVYEIGKIQRFNFFFQITQKFQKTLKKIKIYIFLFFKLLLLLLFQYLKIYKDILKHCIL
jgi:hypothetical protein